MTSIYSACLDCKAAYLQGRQTGRQFLFALQKRVDFKNNPYSKPVVQSILKDLNLDVPIFNADRNSDLAADFVTLDQRIANEMGIKRFSDSVIFNYNCDRDFGVLVDGDTPEHVIIDLFKTNQIKTHFSDEHDALHLYKKG